MRRRQFLGLVSATAILPATRPALAGTMAAIPVSSPPTEGFAASGEQRDFFHRPRHGWVGDPFPFYENGRFRILYLAAWRDRRHSPQEELLYWPSSWYYTSSDDFVRFTDDVRSLPRGNRDQQDYSCYAGSVIEVHGRYHMFYAGNNRHFPKLGKPSNGVMHAVSDDLFNWTKLPGDTFYAPADRYDFNDWRDPFVFWNEEAKEYWMLVTARLKSGPLRRRGCLALCASKDLGKWDVREPFFAPGMYFDLECSDLFRMGEWWYLVFSEFSEQHRTRYRMSRSLQGPWRVPENDSFDGRAFYAGKTASDGHRRFIFGWNPTRSSNVDYLRWNLDNGLEDCKPPADGQMFGPSGWDWGGNLVVHELVQESDGSLSVRVPPTVDAAFSKELPYKFGSAAGAVQTEDADIYLHGPGEFVCLPAEPMPDRCRIEATVVFESGTHGCGLALRMSEDLESAYYIRLEPLSNRVVFDTWPRSGDVPFEAGLERPLKLRSGKPVNLKVFVDGTTCVVYADDKVAMNSRLYDLKHGRWGIFAHQGSARFRNVRISTL